MTPVQLVPAVPADALGPPDAVDPRDPHLFRSGLAEARAALAEATHRKHDRDAARIEAAIDAAASDAAQRARDTMADGARA